MARILLVCGLVVPLAAVMACGDDTTPPATDAGDATDAGSSSDSGAMDSGAARDTGISVQMDGGDTTDAGAADAGVDAGPCIDEDEDGYGDGCAAGSDCEDDDPDVNPGAPEDCDGVDQDCSGTPDDNLTPPPCPLTMGICAAAAQECGGVTGWRDCTTASYGADYEVDETTCDLLDNDCDGTTDEVVPTWYVDCDGDGFAASTTGSLLECMEPPVAMTGCTGTGAWTMVEPVDTSDTDCNDDDAVIFPGQTMWFTTRITGAPGATAYDYDCSGANERRYTMRSRFAPLCPSGPSGCPDIGFWSDMTIPACGDSGSLWECRGVMCAPIIRPATQSCH